jgi:hypothetical protein
LERDEQALRAVIHGLDDLEARAAALQAEFAAGRRSYDNEADNDAVRQLLLAYINYRSALIRMVWKYGRHDQLPAEPDRLRAFLLDYTAACVLCESSLKFVHNFNRSPETIHRLNEGEPVWNIPAGLYDTIQHNLSSRASAELLASAGQLYEEQSADLERNGLGRETAFAPFHAAIDRANATMDRLADPLWRQKARVATKDLAQLVSRVRYDSQSMISTWIGDVKIRNPRQGVSLIPPEHVERLRTALKPGDVLIERRNWYMSNAFLPGYWPHAALYVGTADDLRRMGLDQHPYIRPHWEEFARPDHEQHAHVIVEALSDGVVFASLEHSIGGGDSAAVLRPRLSEEQIKEAIALAFSHAGKPYDFEFDFETHDKLVCTEVVYRAYGANLGPIHFPQKEILGRRTMPAIELVRKYRDEAGRPEAEFDFVAFIDGDEITGAAEFHDDPAVFVTTVDRPALTFLQGFDAAPLRRIGPLGWTMLGLIGMCSIGNFVVQWRTERPYTG